MKFLHESQANVKISFVYISEAHAVDVWNIGLSAGTLNYKHKTIEDRSSCADKFIKEYDFPIDTYLDNMKDELRDELAAWPFRFFVINYETDVYKFKHIGMPKDSQFDLLEILEHI